MELPKPNLCRMGETHRSDVIDGLRYAPPILPKKA